MTKYQKCTMFHSFYPVSKNVQRCRRCGAEQVTLPAGSVDSLQMAATWVNHAASTEMLRLAAKRLLEITGELKND